MASNSVSVAATKTRAGGAVRKGRRTGAIIGSQQDAPLQDGMEDYDAMFAKSPEPNPAEKENNTTADKTVVKRTRFSLPGVLPDDDETSRASSSGGRSAHRKKSSRIVNKYLNLMDRNSMSPSELSRVSTAPPSMDRSFVTQHEDSDEEEEDVEQVRKSQENPAEDSVVLKEASRPDEFSNMDVVPAMHDDDDDFPAVDDNYDDDDEDLAPPPPPDSPQADEIGDDEPERNESPSNVGFPSELDHDDDDDKEGVGYNMADSDIEPETPTSVREEQRKKADKLAEKKKRKKKSKAVDESMDDEDGTVKSVPRKSKKRKNKTRNPFTPKGIPSGPREFEAVLVSDLKDSPKEGQENLRRSKRAQVQPLEFWKNERIIYGPDEKFWASQEIGEDIQDSLGNMPVPKQISRALPTPYKPRKISRFTAAAASGKGKSKKDAYGEVAQAEMEPFDSRKIRKKHDYIDSDMATLWDDAIGEAVQQRKSLQQVCLEAARHLLITQRHCVSLVILLLYSTGIVAYNDDLEPRNLPLSKSRKKGEGKVVGQASSAFNVPNEDNSDYVGYIMGNLTLPPKGIKDSESVGFCAQTFTVVTGQAGALEIAYGDPDQMNGTLDPETAHRFLLGPKDLFRIPPGNCYRLENHSKHAECFLTWTIIRPTSSAASRSPA